MLPLAGEFLGLVTHHVKDDSKSSEFSPEWVVMKVFRRASHHTTRGNSHLRFSTLLPVDVTFTQSMSDAFSCVLTSKCWNPGVVGDTYGQRGEKRNRWFERVRVRSTYDSWETSLQLFESPRQSESSRISCTTEIWTTEEKTKRR